jgi:hypothetical protein
MLVLAFFPVQSERSRMELLVGNMTFRWLRGRLDAPVWAVTMFTKNRDALLSADITILAS